MIAVLDTNVLVSGLMPNSHAPRNLLNQIRSLQLDVALDYRIWQEYCEVLARSRLRKYFSTALKDEWLGIIRACAHWVTCELTVSGLPDPKDAGFLEVALQTGAPLITGNLKHFPAKLCRGALVFTPAEFLKEYFHA